MTEMPSEPTCYICGKAKSEHVNRRCPTEQPSDSPKPQATCKMCDMGRSPCIRHETTPADSPTPSPEPETCHVVVRLIGPDERNQLCGRTMPCAFHPSMPAPSPDASELEHVLMTHNRRIHPRWADGRVCGDFVDGWNAHAERAKQAIDDYTHATLIRQNTISELRAQISELQRALDDQSRLMRAANTNAIVVVGNLERERDEARQALAAKDEEYDTLTRRHIARGRQWDDERASLQQRIAELSTGIPCKLAHANNAVLVERIEQLEQRALKAEERNGELVKYADKVGHTRGCSLDPPNGIKCDCGLAELMGDKSSVVKDYRQTLREQLGEIVK